MLNILFNTPVPSPVSPYPPNIPVSGSTLPLIWGALILVLIVIVVMTFYKPKTSDKTRPADKAGE